MKRPRLGNCVYGLCLLLTAAVGSSAPPTPGTVKEVQRVQPVLLVEGTFTRDGLKVEKVTPGGPGTALQPVDGRPGIKGSLEAGDIITAVDGIPIRNPGDFYDLLLSAYKRNNGSVKLSILDPATKKPLVWLAKPTLLRMNVTAAAPARVETGKTCGTVCRAGSAFAGSKPAKGQTVEVDVTQPDGKVKREKMVVGPKAVIADQARWDLGSTLVIKFLDGTEDPDFLAQVENLMRTWEQFVNLRFEFTTDPQVVAPIRVTFKGTGYNSYVGKGCLQITDQAAHTMRLGGLNARSRPEEVQRVVLHEFGHALGYHHEHQSPAQGIPWDKKKAMEYYKQTQGWTEEQVEFNLFKLLDESTVLWTDYDPTSIMHYPIPKELTTNGFSVGWNTRLSALDTESASAWYPAADVEDLGISVRVAPGTKERGVVIASVAGASPATRMVSAGQPNAKQVLQAGDRDRKSVV